MIDNWQSASACDLGRAIDAGKVDPLDLTKAFLKAIDKHPYRDRIYTIVTTERALREATDASVRAIAQKRRSLLDGVPISWKDLFDTKDIPTEAGTALLKGRTPKTDAMVVKNATNAGLVCLGKTHMSELAFSGLGINPVTETPPNFFDHEAIPGGSSSGAAASVAFGLAAAGIGSDTGGSVRIPSAWNGLVGLKTTSGQLSLDGVVPLCPKFDTVGPLCRSVEDASYLNAIMAGKKPSDLKPQSLDGAQIMVPSNIALDELEPAIATEFERNLESLRTAGANIRRRPIDGLQTAFDLAGCLFTYEAYNQWRDLIEADPDKMYPEILARFRSGANYSNAQYQEAWATLNDIRAKYQNLTQGFDAVILPSSPITPPHLVSLQQDSKLYVRTNLLALRNTRMGNLLGVCAVNIPTDLAAYGLMLMASPNQEDAALSMALAVKNAL